MKKLLFLILILILCLCLCACGGCGQNDQPTVAPVSTQSTETEPALTSHPLLEKMYGKWVWTNKDHPNSGFLFETLTVNEDGTCLVDGESLIWKISPDSNEEEIRIDFYRGDEIVCGAVYDSDDYFYGVTENGSMAPPLHTNSAMLMEQLLAAEPASSIFGHWILAHENEGAPQELVINDDGTCTVNGEEFTWDIWYIEKDRFGITVSDGAQTVYSLEVSDLYSVRETVIILETDSAEAVYINPAHYEIIEITSDNLMDYFEACCSIEWVENAFGEVENFRCPYSIQLKEEYVHRLSFIAVYGSSGDPVLTKNAIELSYSCAMINCDIDLQNKSCEVYEGEYEFIENRTCMGKFDLHPNGEPYRMFLDYPHRTDNDRIPYLYDFQVVRSDCTLYLVKESAE